MALVSVEKSKAPPRSDTVKIIFAARLIVVPSLVSSRSRFGQRERIYVASP
jgi:hypothetical protein